MRVEIIVLMLVMFSSMAANAAFTICRPAQPEEGCAEGQYFCSMVGWIGPGHDFCSDNDVGKRPTHFSVKMTDENGELIYQEESHLGVSDSVEPF